MIRERENSFPSILILDLGWGFVIRQGWIFLKISCFFQGSGEALEHFVTQVWCLKTVQNFQDYTISLTPIKLPLFPVILYSEFIINVTTHTIKKGKQCKLLLLEKVDIKEMRNAELRTHYRKLYVQLSQAFDIFQSNDAQE